jgi:biotin carboxyl carrier protein
VVDVIPLGRGLYRLVDGSRRRVAYAAGAPEARWVFLDGRVYVIDTVRLKTDATYVGSDTTYVASGFSRTGTAATGRAQDDELALAAPMPATVASIHVAEGQEVETGDLLLVLEAMKMELPIRAPRRGRVKAVACRRGELVQPGVPLVALE